MKKLTVFIITALMMALPLNAAFGKTVIKLANAGPDSPDNRGTWSVPC